MLIIHDSEKQQIEPEEPSTINEEVSKDPPSSVQQKVEPEQTPKKPDVSNLINKIFKNQNSM